MAAETTVTKTLEATLVPPTAHKERRLQRFDHYQNALTDIVEKASRDAVAYAQRFDDAVIVLENLDYIRENLDYGAFMNRRLHAWAFAQLQGRIEDKARNVGVPVRYVHPQHTSKACHACNHVGYRDSQGEFRCTNDDCWVTAYHADINAAAKIAHRLDPWGESLPWKPAGNDSPRDGSPSDRATGHRESCRRSRQLTLSAFGSETSSDDDASHVGRPAAHAGEDATSHTEGSLTVALFPISRNIW